MPKDTSSHSPREIFPLGCYDHIFYHIFNVNISSPLHLFQLVGSKSPDWYISQALTKFNISFPLHLFQLVGSKSAHWYISQALTKCKICSRSSLYWLSTDFQPNCNSPLESACRCNKKHKWLSIRLMRSQHTLSNSGHSSLIGKRPYEPICT
jgi:hypothetical protein